MKSVVHLPRHRRKAKEAEEFIDYFEFKYGTKLQELIPTLEQKFQEILKEALEKLEGFSQEEREIIICGLAKKLNDRRLSWHLADMMMIEDPRQETVLGLNKN
jgi:hypothetical protein